jgi:hypothetical protein
MRNFNDIIDVSCVLLNEIKHTSVHRTPAYLKPCPDVATEKPVIDHLIPFTPVPGTKCLHCGNDVGVPVHAVERFSEKLRTFFVFGYFCSWNCSKAYLCDNGNHVGARCAMTFHLYKIMGGKKPCIRAAPPRCAMKEYGGTIPTLVFRQACSDLAELGVQPMQPFRVRFV